MSGAADGLSMVEATGEAADGQVKITLTGAGGIAGVVILPKAKRLACEDLEAAIKEAFEAADHALRSELVAGGDPVEAVAGDAASSEAGGSSEDADASEGEALREALDDAARRLDGLTELAAELNQAVRKL